MNERLSGGVEAEGGVEGEIGCGLSKPSQI